MRYSGRLGFGLGGDYLERGSAVRKAGWVVRVSQAIIAHFALKINIDRAVIIGELFRGGGTCPRRGGKAAARPPLSPPQTNWQLLAPLPAHTQQLRKGVPF